MEKSFVSISARRRLAWILVAILMSSVIVAGATFRRTTGVLDSQFLGASKRLFRSRINNSRQWV